MAGTSRGTTVTRVTNTTVNIGFATMKFTNLRVKAILSMISTMESTRSRIYYKVL